MKRMGFETMLGRPPSGRTHPRKLGLVAVVACLLLPCVFLAALKPNLDPFSIWNLQLSILTSVQLSRVEVVKEDNSASQPSMDECNSPIGQGETDDYDRATSSWYWPEALKMAGTETTILPLALKVDRGENQSSNLVNVSVEVTTLPQEKWENKPISDIKIISLPISDTEMKIENHNITRNGTDQVIEPTGPTSKHEEKQRVNKSDSGTEMPNPTSNLGEIQKEDRSNADTQLLHAPEEKQGPVDNSVESQSMIVPQSQLSCDYSQQRSDTCIMQGDVRVLGHSSSIILASPFQSDVSAGSSTRKIRPYARKWEPPVMQTIKELTLGPTTKSEESPRCTVSHSTVPAIVFSTGGFLGNFFHDFTDVLIPLFITSRQYQGEVRFLVTDFNPRWVGKYRPILSQLSRYEIIDLDGDGRVHCFRQAQVGLISNKEFGMDPSKTPNGYSMADFREMLRPSFSWPSFSLKRKVIRSPKRRPRLLILQRKGSRSFMNKREVVGLGRSLGFKVVVAGSEETKNLSRFARVVNSCDVMMGVHGAGLTNMVFLPAGSTVIQIVPLGGLKWACRHDFGEPAPDMGVHYLEYEIGEEESSLIQQYPRDHPVFTDPLSIQKQGWNALWSVFLDKQKVKLDVRRFKPVLLEALRSVH